MPITYTASSSSSSGSITGPVSSTDTAVAVWSGTGGNTLADSNLLHTSTAVWNFTSGSQYVQLSWYGSDANFWPEFQLRRARGTAAVPLLVNSADNSLGKITWLGYDGVSYAESGAISYGVDETFSSTAHGGHMHFWTTKNTTAAPRVVARMGQDSITTVYGQFKLKPEDGNNSSQEYWGFAIDECRATGDNNGQTINCFNLTAPTTAGNLFAFNCHGNTGTQYARFDFRAAENWGGGTFGTLFNVYTTVIGEATKAVRFKIDGLGIGRFAYGGVSTQLSSANVSVVPTQAEMVSAFGAASDKGAGWIGVINDNGATTGPVWLAVSNATNYFYVAATIGA